ncbi:MAG: YfhO family protein [Erysipelotrichaceae bacterium]|nr:YfhO family protein [Erysipelotrichaceae bacterium]
MKKMIREEKKTLLLLFILVTGISLVYFSPSLFYGVPLTYGTDIKPQWFEFYTEFRNLIRTFLRERELPFYSWNSFLGNDFYSSKSYYVMGDPYNYLSLLMDGSFFDIARDLSYLKFLVAAYGFYFFLSELNIRPYAKLLTSLAYAFSGWAVFFSGQLVFLSFYSFIPYYLLGMERTMQKKNGIIFILSCALLFSTNWYFFYTLTVLTPFYFLYRYFRHDLPLKELPFSILKHILLYLSGILITAVIWLPGILYALASSRYIALRDLGILPRLHYLVTTFVPNYLYLYKNNVFETDVHYSREIVGWAGTSLLMIIPQFLKFFRKKDKYLTVLFYGLFLLIAFIPQLDSAMHGFGDPSFRWTFFLIIFDLMIAAECLDRFEETDRKALLAAFAGYVLLSGGCFLLALKSQDAALSDYSAHFLLCVVFCAVALLGVLLLYFRSRRGFALLLVAELCISGFFCYRNDILDLHKQEEDYAYISSLTTVLQDQPGEFAEKLRSLAPENPQEFYRVYVPYDSVYWSFSHNMSLLYGIRGLMTYDSTYAYSFISMYQMEPCVASYNSGWIFNIEDNELMNFFNTKYAVVTAQETLADNWVLIDDDFHYGLKLYENQAYQPLGKTYNALMTEDDYKNGRDTSLFNTHVICNYFHDIISASLSDLDCHLENIDAAHNHLYAEYTAEKKGFMVIAIPYDRGWTLKVDGQPTEFYNVNGGFIGLPVQEGHHTLTMEFVPYGFQAGAALSVLGMITTAAYLFISRKSKTA